MSRSDVEVPAFWTLFFKPKLTSDPKDSIAWKGSEYLIGVISKVDANCVMKTNIRKCQFLGRRLQEDIFWSEFNPLYTYIYNFFQSFISSFLNEKMAVIFVPLSLFFWKRMLNLTSSCMADLSSWQLIQEIKGLRIFHHPIMDGIENGRDAGMVGGGKEMVSKK